MEYLITNLNKKELEIIKQSKLEWYIDDFDDETILMFETEKECYKALKLIGRTN